MGCGTSTHLGRAFSLLLPRPPLSRLGSFASVLSRAPPAATGHWATRSSGVSRPALLPASGALHLFLRHRAGEPEHGALFMCHAIPHDEHDSVAGAASLLYTRIHHGSSVRYASISLSMRVRLGREIARLPIANKPFWQHSLLQSCEITVAI